MCDSYILLLLAFSEVHEMGRCSTNGGRGEERNAYIGGEARRNETTGKTKT
jgi:hypothetical protein